MVFITAREAAQSSSSNPVSWQSGFWALVPLTLKSMSQPSGMVCDLPSKRISVLQSSPIICFLDVTFVIGRLAWYANASKSPRAAVERTVRLRFQDVVDQAEESSLASLQKNTLFRFLMFVLGVLPQIIKLYDMRGLPWTKLWASLFLSSFFVIELLVLISKRFRRPLPPDQPQIGDRARSTPDSWLQAGALLAGLAFSSYFFSTAIMTLTGRYTGETFWLHNFISMAFGFVQTCNLAFPGGEPLSITSELLTPSIMVIFNTSFPSYLKALVVVWPNMAVHLLLNSVVLYGPSVLTNINIPPSTSACQPPASESRQYCNLGPTFTAERRCCSALLHSQV